MRKCFFYIVLLLTTAVFTSEIFASETFVFSRNRETRTLTYSFSQKGVRYLTSLTQGKDGKFSVSAPPFLIVKTKNGWRIGELKFPDNSDSVSMKPALSGISKSFDRLEVAAFTPLLNPLSPSGFLVSWENPHLETSLMKTDYGKTAEKGIAQNYQIDWKSLPSFNDSIDFKVNFKETFKSAKLRSSLFATYSFIYDYDLGYSGNSVWKFQTESEKIRFEFTDSFGTGKENIRNQYCVSLETKGVINIGFCYGTKTYPMPIYGGRSKGYMVEYSTSASYRRFSISGKHIIEIKEDTGHNESSEYKIRLYLPDMNDNHLSLAGEVNQKRGEVYSIEKYSIKIRDKNAMLEFTDKKTLLTLSCSWVFNEIKCKVSITQDKAVTLSSGIRR